MDFSIYTLGDVTLFERALQGVAMMFTVASGGNTTLWASNSSLGVGLGAVFGGLIAMIVMIYNGALKRQLDWRNLLLPTLLYVALTGPKTDVTIIDAYSQQAPRVVSGVPLGLAFPLGFISQLAYKATEKLETVFSVPYAGFTKITDEGYVSPLKILNSLRFSGVAFGGATPDFQGILTNIYTVCLINNEAFDINEYNSSINPFGVLKTALNAPTVMNRNVKIVTTGETVTAQMMSCGKTADLLENSMNAYITGTNNGDAFSLLTNDELKINNLSKDVDRVMARQNGSKQGISTMSEGKIMDTLMKFTTPNNEQIMQYMHGALLNTSLSGVTQCSYDTSKASLAKCQSYLTAIEQWKDKSASQGTGFVAIMRDGQNLLIVLSIILFPIMVLILVIQGAGSLKVMGSFILYTVSAFMWLPVASILNYYTHLQLYEEFRRWNPNGDPTMFLTIKNSGGFYDAISQKLALANTALASVPMICMGLFSGMLMTMNRLTDMWNHSSNTFDVKANTPDAVSRAPIVDVAPSVNYANANAIGTVNGLSKTFDSSAGLKRSQSIEQVKSAEEKFSASFHNLKNHELSKSLSESEKMSVVKDAMQKHSAGNRSYNITEDMVTDVYDKYFGKQGARSDAETNDNGDRKSEAEVYQSTLENSLSGNAQTQRVAEKEKIGPDTNDTKRTFKPENSGGVKLASANVIQNEDRNVATDVDTTKNEDMRSERYGDGTKGSYTRADSNKVGSANFNSTEFATTLATSLANSVSEKNSSRMSESAGSTFTEAYSETMNASETLKEKYGVAFSQSRSAGELLNASANSPELAQRMQNAIEEGRKLNPEKFAQAEQQNYENLKGTAQTALNEQDARTLSQFQALKSLGSDGMKLALTAEHGNYELGHLRQEIPSVQGLVEKGIGNAREQVKVAMNTDYDVDQKMQEIRNLHDKVASENREGASQQSYKYTDVDDKYRINVVLGVGKDTYDNSIAQASEKYGVPEGLIKAMIHTESNFDSMAKSPVGASGLMQLMPATSKEMGVRNANNAHENIMGGTKYIAQQLDRFDGNVSLALAAYNAGAGNVDKYGGIPPFKETQEYVQKVQARFENLYPNGVESEGRLENDRGALIARNR